MLNNLSPLALVAYVAIQELFPRVCKLLLTLLKQVYPSNFILSSISSLCVRPLPPMACRILLPAGLGSGLPFIVSRIRFPTRTNGLLPADRVDETAEQDDGTAFEATYYFLERVFA